MKEQQLTLDGSAVLSKLEKKKHEKDFVDGVLSVFRPMIVWPGYEDMPIPEKIKMQVQIERLVLAAKGEKLASETEAMWYISTASLASPLDREWCNIFMHLTRKYITKIKQELPDFLKDEIVLEKYTEENQLNRLREWLYKKGMEAMKK